MASKPELVFLGCGHNFKQFSVEEATGCMEIGRSRLPLNCFVALRLIETVPGRLFLVKYICVVNLDANLVDLIGGFDFGLFQLSVVD